MKPYALFLLCLSLLLPLHAAEHAAADAQTPQTITLRNELSELVLDVKWAEITHFKLLHHHPLGIDEKLGGNPALDPEDPLAVLGPFHDKYQGHNVIITKADGSWQLQSHDETTAVFSRQVNGLNYTLTYTLDPRKPTVHSSWQISNPSDRDRSFNAQISALTGVHQDLAANDAYFNGIYYYEDESLEGLGFPELPTSRENLLSYKWQETSEYIAIRSRFFAGIWSLDRAAVSSLGDSSEDTETENTDEGNAGLSLTDTENLEVMDEDIHLHTKIIAAAFEGGPGNARQHQARINVVFYNGKSKKGLPLLQVKARESYTISWYTTAASMTTENLALLSPAEQELEFASAWYRFFSLISNLLLKLLNFLNWCFEQIGLESIAYGLAVICTTAIVKGLLHRVTYKQQYSMMKMQQLAPELRRLQAQYKDDRQAMAMKQMELWKKHGVNPLGGCLPLLIQMPIFFALFQVFNHAADMRGHGFLWVNDLTLPDQTIPLGFNWPLIGTPASINLLPMIYLPVALFQSLSMKMTTPSSGDKQKDEMQATMQKMFRFMPIFFFVFIYFFASGLVLYITVSSLWTLIEIRLIRKQLGMDKPAEDKAAPTAEEKPAEKF